MGSKGTMLLLWFVAIAAVVQVAMQPAARTWVAYFWVAACSSIAIVATIMFEVQRKRQKRWDAGRYD
jgi:hypothetical protein